MGGLTIPYTDEEAAALSQAIAERIAQGETLSAICREPGMPCRRQVNCWRNEYPEIGALFFTARDDGFDAIAERTRETARGRGDSMDDVQRDKLIIETDLKLLAKWDPRRYGDRTIVAGDKDNPLEFRTRSEAEIDARLKQLGWTPPEPASGFAPLKPMGWSKSD